jgi:hypothetical protein
MIDNPTKTLSVDLFGHVQVPVTGTLVIKMPVDATEEEIAGLGEELEGLVQQWENPDGIREDPDDVTGTGEVEVDDVDEEADFTFLRNAEGKLALQRMNS